MSIETILSYKDCEELIAAGFPRIQYYTGGSVAEGNKGIKNIPNLEILIHECGEITLLVGNDKSVALNNKNPLGSTARGDGLSPIQAVKNLYVALHSVRSEFELKPEIGGLMGTLEDPAR